MSELSTVLARLIRSQLDGTSVMGTDIDYMDELISIAAKNQINCLVSGALIKLPLDESMKDRLRKVIKRSTFLTLLQTTELRKIEDVFERNSVKCLLLKGAIMKYVYPSPELREMSDLDILVDEDSFERSTKLLEDIGYSLATDVDHHAVYHNGSGVIVELHHTLCEAEADHMLNEYFNDFNHCILKEGKQFIYEFDLESFYIYMVAHMARHFYVKGCGVRNLIDLYVFHNVYQNNVDWDGVALTLKQLGLSDFEINMNSLSRTWLDLAPLSDFENNLFHYMLDGGVYGRDENGFWNKYRVSQDGKKVNYQKQLKRWYYFPSLNYMQEYYPVLHKHPGLLFFMWIRRGFNGIFSKDGMGKDKLHKIKKVDEDTVCMMSEIYQRMNLNFKN